MSRGMLPFDFTGLASDLKRARKALVPVLRKGQSAVANMLALTRRGATALREIARRCRRRTALLPRIESLKVKLLLAVSVVAVCILGLTYSSLSASAHSVAAEQARRRASEILSYFSGVYSEAVAARDIMQIHLMSRTLLDHGIKGILITDSNDKVIFTSNPEVERCIEPDSGGSLRETPGLRGETMLHATKPIRFGADRVGALHVCLSRTDLDKEILESQAFIYPIVISGFLLMILVGAVATHTPFRVLKRLTMEAKLIGEGNLSRRVPAEGNDEVADFCKAFNDMVDGLARARQTILRSHLEIIGAMISVVEAKDRYTQGHCVRVQGYARRILAKMKGVSPEEAALVETAALLHDMGKIGIPDAVLLKEQRLSKEEMDVVRQHVIIGEKILLHMDSMKDVARWVRHHHERWDGLGYPDGLRGEAIPLASRIIGVADALDAMLTDRPYRKALSRNKAAEALAEGRGTQFDPQIVDHAIGCIEREEEDVVQAAYA